MLPSVFVLWKIRQGRKAAVAAILPRVNQSRRHLNGIPDLAWLDPHLVGFMVTLITLVARRECNVPDTQALGLVQSEAWAEITGMRPDLIGDEVLALSAARHNAFELGCRNAVSFAEAFYGSLSHYGDHGAHAMNASVAGPSPIEPIKMLEHENALVSLWACYFEEHVAALSLAQARH